MVQPIHKSTQSYPHPHTIPSIEPEVNLPNFWESLFPPLVHWEDLEGSGGEGGGRGDRDGEHM